VLRLLPRRGRFRLAYALGDQIGKIVLSSDRPGLPSGSYAKNTNSGASRSASRLLTTGPGIGTWAASGW